MNTYAVMLNCQGDEEHEPHSEPMIIVSIAETLDDADKLAGLLLLLISNEEDSVDEIEGSAEKVAEMGAAIADVVNKYLEEETVEIDPFSEIEELGNDIEFKA